MLVGYSMGAWIAYEVLCLLQQYHLAPPVHFVAVAMVSPDLPIHLRPWKRTASLDTQGFQVRFSGVRTPQRCMYTSQETYDFVLSFFFLADLCTAAVFTLLLGFAGLLHSTAYSICCRSPFILHVFRV